MICLLGEVWTGPILSIPLQFSRFGSRNVLFDDGRMILHGCAARNSKNTLHLCISSNFLASQNETRSGTQSCLYIHIYLYNRKVHIPVYICSHIYVYIYIYIYIRHTHTHTHCYPHIELCRSHSLCLGLFGPELGLLWAGPCCQKSSRILMDTVLYFFIFERSPHVPKILHRTLVICVSSFLLFSYFSLNFHVFNDFLTFFLYFYRKYIIFNDF